MYYNIIKGVEHRVDNHKAMRMNVVTDLRPDNSENMCGF